MLSGLMQSQHPVSAEMHFEVILGMHMFIIYVRLSVCIERVVGFLLPFISERSSGEEDYMYLQRA